MSFLTYEQKMEAMQELAPAAGNLALHMRHPGNWYCAIGGVYIADRSFIKGLHGDGETPAEAIEDLWDRLTSQLHPGEVLEVNNDRDQCYIWNGSRWQRTLHPANA